MALEKYKTQKSKEEDIRMKEANRKQDHVCYTFQDKARFFDLKIEKCMSASAAAKRLGIQFERRRDRLSSVMCVL